MYNINYEPFNIFIKITKSYKNTVLLLVNDMQTLSPSPTQKWPKWVLGAKRCTMFWNIQKQFHYLFKLFYLTKFQFQVSVTWKFFNKIFNEKISFALILLATRTKCIFEDSNWMKKCFFLESSCVCKFFFYQNQCKK